MPDYTNFFAEAFQKHDAMTKSQHVSNGGAQILDPNMIGHMPKQDSVVAVPEDDSHVRAYEKSKYPEKSGAKKFEEKKKKEEMYKSILGKITRDEFDTLNYLKKNGGYVCLDKNILKSIGEQGESLHTDRLEKWGLMKRDKVDSELIQFTILSMGKSILSDLKKITGEE